MTNLIPILASFKSWFTYTVGVRPSVWQLPNPLKIYEFHELTRDVELHPHERILDLGCGRGIQAQLLARRGPTVVGIDPGEKYIRNAKRELRWSQVRSRVEFHCGVLEQFSFQRRNFDKVFSFCVMEHIPNLPVVLAQIREFLRPGGEIHATVDALANVHDSAILEEHRALYKVMRYFRPRDVKEVFGAAGFRLIAQRYILRSRTAVRELENEIRTKQGSWPPSRRRLGFRKLKRDEDPFGDADPGIMILCRLARD